MLCKITVLCLVTVFASALPTNGIVYRRTAPFIPTGHPHCAAEPPRPSSVHAHTFDQPILPGPYEAAPHEAEREPWWRQDSRYSEVQRKNRRTVFMHDDWLKHRSSNRFFRNIRTIGSPASSECPSSQRPCDHPPPRRPSRHLLVLRAALWVWEESLGANKRLWRHCVACPKSANSLPFTV